MIDGARHQSRGDGLLPIIRSSSVFSCIELIGYDVAVVNTQSCPPLAGRTYVADTNHFLVGRLLKFSPTELVLCFDWNPNNHHQYRSHKDKEREEEEKEEEEEDIPAYTTSLPTQTDR